VRLRVSTVMLVHKAISYVDLLALSIDLSTVHIFGRYRLMVTVFIKVGGSCDSPTLSVYQLRPISCRLETSWVA